ncbi:GDSL-type esterase/lipase family protein [Chengkuizengella sediminis]|uniref:GDSL-type esterase/lipase family protein n=1 Tax=Chengkuizengella sediminis TaxID=1885917 RepID=UPI001389B841|nr:GDSL-type esterase/lipase family protein [Chengkuizengella sediminis]NDI34958.1 hypothetical protein [Chengkuizengella sediminis]
MRKNKLYIIMMIVCFLLANVSIPQVHAESNTLNYVALGDSIAAGYTPEGEIDEGYSDFIEEYLTEDEPLITYTKQFAIPGLTTSDLNGLIQQNLSTEQFLSLFGGGFPAPLVGEISNNIRIENLTIQDAIEDADVITLTIGANDILSEIPYDVATGTIDMSGIDIDQITTKMGEVEENLSSVLEQIFELNDEVQVYVSGYYFPYPHLYDQMLPEEIINLQSTLNSLNSIILDATNDHNDAFYVSLEGVFPNDPIEYLPNEQIHPTVVGYELIAQRFIDVMEEQANGLPEPPEPEETTLTLNYVALGDSIAAGFTPEGEIDEGYSDFIEEYLTEDEPLITYTKQFAIPGLTTSDLNGLIENDLSTEQFLLLFGGEFPAPLVGEISENISIENLTIQDAIEEADVITLTIGANDILSEIPYDAGTGTIDMSGIDSEQLTTKMGEVEENLSSVLEQIFALNDEVQVYVSGYYFPYPHLIDQVPQAQLDILLGTLGSLNSIIIDATNDHNDAFYVSLDAVFPNDPFLYLLPGEIHPTEAGYQLIADRFIEVMEEQANGLPEPPEETTLNYIALGDSIAAGFTPTRTIDKGYTDFIEEYLTEDEPLITYTKQFAIPGLTTSDLNGLIENDLSTEQFLLLFGGEFPAPLVGEISENISIENLTIQDAIEEADVITLTIGANDILSEIPYDAGTGTIDMSGIDSEQLTTKMGEVEENLSSVLEQIFALNDEVQVYVSGYYFPYPHLIDQVPQAQLDILLGTLGSLNSIIIDATNDHNDAFYVSLDAVFPNDPFLYLLPGEIHPTEAGYQLIADRFINVMEEQAENSQEMNEPEETTESRNTSSTNSNRGNETENDPEVVEPEVVEPELDPETTEITTEQKFETLKTIGIFSGYEDGQPHLEDVMTREQAAKIIALLLGLNIEDADSLDESQYSDVEQERWSYKYIAAATKAGIMNGVGDNKFDSTGNVTMEQFIKILVEGYAFVSGIEIAANENLEVENASGWAKKYVVAAIQLGLMEEQADYTLPASRALLVEGAYTIFQTLYEE